MKRIKLRKGKFFDTVSPGTTELQAGPSQTEEQSFDMVSRLYVFSLWVEPSTTTRRLTVAILLLSGVGRGKFSIRVSADGSALESTIIETEPLISICILHHKWLQSTSDDLIEACHPKLTGFERHLETFRSRNIDSVELTARIVVLFQTKSNISQKFNSA